MKKTKMIGFKTTEETYRKLQEIAEKEDRSISYICNKIIEEWFQKKP